MPVRKLFKVRDVKVAAVVAALLFAMGLVSMAQPAGAATCLDCDTGGGGGETVPPTVTSVAPANGATNVVPAANVTVTFDEDMDAASITDSTFTLVRQGQTTPVAATVSYDSATKTATLNPDADLAQKASYTATVKGGAGGVTDVSGNPLAADHTWSFTVPDSTKPTVSLTSPAPEAYVRGTVLIAATASDNVGMSHVAFRVQGGVWQEYDYSAPYGMSWDSTQSPDGRVTLQAIAYDTSSNWAEHTYSIIVDNTAPVVSITSGPRGTVNTSSAAFGFSATDANLDTLKCKLDSGQFHDCSSTITYTGLTDGGHSLEIVGRDKAGNSATEIRNWTVDTTAPAGSVKIDGGAAYTKNTAVKLALSAEDLNGVESMRFSNDGANWSTWEPYATGKSWTLSGGNGTRTVHAQYRDKAGNVSTAARDTITLDTAAPNTSIASGPATITKSTATTLSFSSEAGARFQCSLDGAAFTACASPKSYTGLKNGSHNFRVRAIDGAGNVDATPAIRTWTVDTIKPTISGMSPRHKSIIRDTTPTIKATVKDNMTNLSKGNIRLYVAGKAIPASKFSYNRATDQLVYNSPKLSKGKKTVRVVATDAAKNVGARSWYFTIR
jgi:hypothetical protein